MSTQNKKHKNKNSKKKRSIKKLLFNLIPVFIIGGGLFYYFFPPEYWLANHLKNNTKIERITPKRTLEASVVNSHPSEAPSYGNQNQLEATASNLYQATKIDYIASGGIFIPKAGIRLPVYHGIGDYTMLKGAGEQFSSEVVTVGGKGNYVLASHRTPYQGYLFSDLHVVGAGDEFYVVGSDTDMIYQYKVDWTEVFDPNEDWAIQQDEAKSISDTVESTKTISLDELNGFPEKSVGATSVSTKKDFDFNVGKETKKDTQLTIISINEEARTATIKEQVTTTVSDYICTLYTCTDNFATHRLVVRSHLSAIISIDEAPQELKDAYSGWFSATF